MTEQVDIAVSENQRLKREVRQLHERIAALEESRWWRLHPRFALERLAGRLRRPRRPADPHPAASTSQADEKPADDLRTAFVDEVVSRGDFTEDWFTVHIPGWEPVLTELERRSARILELGSFEGLSTCYLLWRLPDARVTAVDTFAGLPAYRAYGIASELEDSFDRNVELVDGARVRKLVGETRRMLPALVDEETRFDLVYVDASHRALDVMVDAALSWPLLADGGVAIFDDYGPTPPGEDPLQHPTPAVDAFLSVVAGHYEVVSKARQLIVRKLD